MAEEAMAVTCSLCGSGDVRRVLELDAVPVLCNALWATAEEAKAASTGRFELVFCETCGLLWNRAFDPDLIHYSPAYDNSLHFSPTFQRYADELAARLVERYDLHGKQVVEVGAGSGDFLAKLCDLGDSTGVGWDPSHDPEAPERRISDRVTVIGELFPHDGQALAADLVTCQHVLEHVPDPRGLLADVVAEIRPASEGRPVTYLEVPDATYMLERGAVFDLIYEHRSYFAEPTLRWLFQDTEFRVLDAGRSFGDQYLWVEAASRAAVGPPEPADIDTLRPLVNTFGERFAATVARWNARLPDLSSQGPVGLWGAGSKGVAFLNTIPSGHLISSVVDVNPRKHGKHIPVTGQRVVSPTSEEVTDLRYVVLMNPLYRDEVRRALDDVDSRAELLVV